MHKQTSFHLRTISDKTKQCVTLTDQPWQQQPVVILTRPPEVDHCIPLSTEKIATRLHLQTEHSNLRGKTAALQTVPPVASASVSSNSSPFTF